MNDPLRISDLDQTVMRLKNGEPSAREELIQISWDRLHQLAKKMLGDFPAVKRWEETDDVFQRATVRLWESLKIVRPENTRHFFNLAALQIRRELIELSRSLNGPLGLNRNQDSVEQTDRLETNVQGIGNADACQLAAWTEFHESIDKLEPEHREVFELIWYQGLSQKSVAELTGVSQKTVSRRWQKSRRHLYEMLGGRLPD